MTTPPATATTAGVVPWPARDALRVTSVRAVVTAPEGWPLVVVRVDTSEPGLYGLGCATLTTRYAAVAAAVEHLAPAVTGRHPADIEDTVRQANFGAYWRNGPVLNNALSGLDMALWDIAGKRAGMPVWELFGGRVHAAVPLYTHAGGATVQDTLERAESYVAGGYQHVRLQVGGPGQGTYGAPGHDGGYPGHPHPDGWDVHRYLRDIPALFAAARARLGEQVQLLHDAHNRLTVKQAIGLCRALEEYRPFFVEDPLAPELFDRLPEVCAATAIPIASGELLSSVPDAVRLVLARGVDLLRVHVSAVGGLTPARKLAVLCELTGVQTAWHGPADVCPVGQAANLALDVSSPAFGIQEGHDYPPLVQDMFPGTPRRVGGYLYPSDEPGLGVDFDEALAAKYPPRPGRHEAWAARVRSPSGAIQPP